jgi:hypothetical protein
MSVRTQIALALWIVVGVAALTVFQALPAKITDYQDFRYYYGGSLALRRGINPYGGDFETIFAQIGTPVGSASAWERAEIQLDTPAWLIFFEPFTFLEPGAAYWAWTAFNLLALGAALFGLIGELGPPGAEGWTVAALMLLYPPIAINFWLAQSEIVLLAIFVLALAALRRGYHGRAGVILAAAALLRAYPLGMLGYLVARRNWRASGYFLTACVRDAPWRSGLPGSNRWRASRAWPRLPRRRMRAECRRDCCGIRQISTSARSCNWCSASARGLPRRRWQSNYSPRESHLQPPPRSKTTAMD